MEKKKSLSKNDIRSLVIVFFILIILILVLGFRNNYVVNRTIKLVYCEYDDTLFIGLNDKKTNEYVKETYGSNMKEPYLLKNALLCRYNLSCSKYNDNDWIYGRTLCKNFNFKIKDLLR